MFKSRWKNWGRSQFVLRFGMRDVPAEKTERELDKRQNRRWENSILLKVAHEEYDAAVMIGRR